MSNDNCTSSCLGWAYDDEVQVLKSRISELEEELDKATSSSVMAKWSTEFDFRDGSCPPFPNGDEFDRFDGLRVRVTVEGLYPCGK